jgi:lipoprotein-anchoring transpeptidase ErfK/SrfK
MKRVAAVFLLATPVWVASGVAGSWLGSPDVAEMPEIAPVGPLASAPVSTPTQVEAARADAPVVKPAARIGTASMPEAPPAQARIDVTPAPKPVVPVAPLAVPSPARPVATMPRSAAPALSLGSTDVLAPEKVLEPTPAEAGAPLSEGVLIVVSLASQKAFVFKNGELWGSTSVSTGRAGKRTPVGHYTILEKQVHHRSRTYDNAPMPYMQRLTWGGVAMHAGHVTGRPASHGCIRLPRSFAKKLYNLTDFSSTTVVVTNRKARSSDEARKAA